MSSPRDANASGAVAIAAIILLLIGLGAWKFLELCLGLAR